MAVTGQLRRGAAHVVGVLIFAAASFALAASPAAARSYQGATKPVQRLVYQTNWKKGLAGWSVARHWEVTRGMLDGGTSGGVVLAPGRTGKLGSFAVEARIRGVSVKGGDNRGWGLLVRNSAAPLSATGIDAGFYAGAARIIDGGRGSLFPSFTESVFDPGSDWHTYRVEVRGTKYRLMLDGAGPYASGTTTRYLSHDYIGLQANVEINVSVFKVYELS